jgi:hypothetical protein
VRECCCRVVQVRARRQRVLRRLLPLVAGAHLGVQHSHHIGRLRAQTLEAGAVSAALTYTGCSALHQTLQDVMQATFWLLGRPSMAAQGMLYLEAAARSANRCGSGAEVQLTRDRWLTVK